MMFNVSERAVQFRKSVVQYLNLSFVVGDNVIEAIFGPFKVKVLLSFCSVIRLLFYAFFVHFATSAIKNFVCDI